MSSTITTSELRNLTLIKAGAGAGKTHKIQQDLTGWVTQGWVKPERILAVTFTNAAAHEMQSRIRQALINANLRKEGEQIQNATISTIHGFGLKIIQDFAYEQGISPKPRQLTDAEQNQLIRQALTQVEALTPLLDDLTAFGYQGKSNGSEYTDAATALKDHVLTVIKQLRALGKSNQTLDAQTSLNLLEATSNHLKSVYGTNLSKAETLNDSLWKAIEDLKAVYPDQEVLDGLWGSNDKTRNFVKAVYQATTDQIQTDWSLWAKLQTIETAPKILGKASKSKPSESHQHAYLGLAIWQAADKLSVHPGPLADAIFHLTQLLKSAIEALSSYQGLKTQAGLVDFNDMVQLAEQVLQSPTYLQEIKNRYDCLIIDEFQDTNPLQFSLLRQFQKAGLPSLIVGDLKQSIMGFQGSDARLFQSLLVQGEQVTEGSVLVDELKNNWRSTPELMQFINAAGEHLYGGSYQSLTVDDKAIYHSELTPVMQLVFESGNWGADGKSKNKANLQVEGQYALASHLKDLLSQGIQVTDKNTRQKRPLKPNDIAVLAPKHNRLEAFAKQLKKLGIQTKLTQPGFLESQAVQWVLYALQFIANPSHQFALLNLLTSDYAGIPLKAALNDYLEKNSFNHPLVERLKESTKSLRLVGFKAAVLGAIDSLDIWQAIQAREDYHQQRANLLKLISLAETFEQTQPESLQAMGLYGKSLQTFQLWLTESAKDKKAEINNQPQIELHAENAIVLSTWHAAKGLEWPIVMVLDAHEEKNTYLPSIDMAYQSDTVDEMLESSYVRFLMDFDDPTTAEKVKQLLRSEARDTLKNLTYVAITRAREQLILPWFEHNLKDNSMLALLKPVFEQANADGKCFECKTKNMIMLDEPDSVPNSIQEHRILKVEPRTCPETIMASLSPSLVEKDTPREITTDLSIQTEVYADFLDLSEWDLLLEANEVGDIIHRVYDVYFSKPTLMEKWRDQLPEGLLKAKSGQVIKNIENNLKNYQAWLNLNLKPLKIDCEVPVLAMNELGQTISGSIDMLIETEDGYWIIDHKTDKQMDFKKHHTQLATYSNALNLQKPILGVGINWVRAGQAEISPKRY